MLRNCKIAKLTGRWVLPLDAPPIKRLRADVLAAGGTAAMVRGWAVDGRVGGTVAFRTPDGALVARDEVAAHLGLGRSLPASTPLPDFRRLMSELLPLSAAAIQRRDEVQRSIKKKLAEAEALASDKVSASYGGDGGAMRELSKRMSMLQV